MDRGYQRFCKGLGRRVAQLRRERELTQEDMMDYGFSIRHYQRIEAGSPITMHTAYRLARAFKVTLAELVEVSVPKRKKRS